MGTHVDIDEEAIALARDLQALLQNGYRASGRGILRIAPGRMRREQCQIGSSTPGFGDEIRIFGQLQALDDSPQHRHRLRQQDLAFNRRFVRCGLCDRRLIASRLTTFGRRGSIMIVAVPV